MALKSNRYIAPVSKPKAPVVTYKAPSVLPTKTLVSISNTIRGLNGGPLPDRPLNPQQTPSGTGDNDNRHQQMTFMPTPPTPMQTIANRINNIPPLPTPTVNRNQVGVDVMSPLGIAAGGNWGTPVGVLFPPSSVPYQPITGRDAMGMIGSAVGNSLGNVFAGIGRDLGMIPARLINTPIMGTGDPRNFTGGSNIGTTTLAPATNRTTTPLTIQDAITSGFNFATTQNQNQMVDPNFVDNGRHADWYEFARDYVQQNGVAPTYNDYQNAVNNSQIGITNAGFPYQPTDIHNLPQWVQDAMNVDGTMPSTFNDSQGSWTNIGIGTMGQATYDDISQMLLNQGIAPAVARGVYNPRTGQYEYFVPTDVAELYLNTEPQTPEVDTTDDGGSGYSSGGYNYGGGGSGGGGGEEQVTPSAPAAWNTYDVENAPTWWIGKAATLFTPDNEWAMATNASIPFLSPEDQAATAKMLFEMFPEIFPEYANISTAMPPSEITPQIFEQYTTATRARSFADALRAMVQATGQSETSLGEGYRYLRNIYEIMNKFGGGAPNTGNRQTRQQYTEMMNAANPLMENAKSNDALSAYNFIVQRLLNPNFTAGPVWDVYKDENGRYIFGRPNQSMF